MAGQFFDVYLTCGAPEPGSRTFGFCSDLYRALSNERIPTYFNYDTLRSWDDIMSSLKKAIESSRVAIVVISQNYDFSSSCLDELRYIVKCCNEKGLLILPIFYRVEPSDVQYYQGGSVGEALKQVAGLKTFHFKRGIIHDRSFFGSLFSAMSLILRRSSSASRREQEDFIMIVVKEVPKMIASQAMWWAKVWRIVGLLSSVVGMLCHAFSPSFTHLIRGWTNFLKIFLYCVFFLVLCASILFARPFPLLRQQRVFRSHVIFAVCIIISVYSFLYDQAVNGKPEIRSLVANAAFTLMSLSLSKLINSRYETGMFGYFLVCLIIQLITIHWALILVAIVFGYPLFVIHSSSDSGNERQLFYSSLNSQPHAASAGQNVVNIQNEESKLVTFYGGYDSDDFYDGRGNRMHI